MRKSQTASQLSDEAAAILPIAICAGYFYKTARKHFSLADQADADSTEKMAAFALPKKAAEISQ